MEMINKSSKEFREALAACRTELGDESPEILASCAESIMLKSILLKKFREID